MRIFLLCSIGRNLPDNYQSCQHQHDGDGQADPCIADKTGNDVGNEGYCCNSQGVGQLSGYVNNVVALAAGGRHDGGIGNGGAVVTADGAGKACGDTDHEQVGIVLEHGQNNGDKEA